MLKMVADHIHDQKIMNNDLNVIYIIRPFGFPDCLSKISKFMSKIPFFPFSVTNYLSKLKKDIAQPRWSS